MTLLRSLFAVPVVLAPLSAQDIPGACRIADDRIPVLILGSYHMSNPGQDQFNLEADDVLAPRRQVEIASLVNALAAFGPTKVAVEAPWGDTVTVGRYDAYARGERDLRRSEEEQIGFRLAHQLGHGTVYPIDVRMGLAMDALGPMIQRERRFGGLMAEVNELGGRVMAQMGAWLGEGTVGQMLHHMNQPRMLAGAHDVYLTYFAPIVADTNYGGADLVATWYQRNLRIFANLTRIAEPGDRLFVVYGQGHAPLLREFVASNAGMCVVDPLPYLEVPEGWLELD